MEETNYVKRRNENKLNNIKQNENEKKNQKKKKLKAIQKTKGNKMSPNSTDRNKTR